MHLYMISREEIQDGLLFRVAIINAKMPPMPTKCNHKLFIRVTIRGTTAKHDLTIILKRNNTDPVAFKGPRGINIVPGEVLG